MFSLKTIDFFEIRRGWVAASNHFSRDGITTLFTTPDRQRASRAAAALRVEHGAIPS
jgi:hypothetical protein